MPLCDSVLVMTVKPGRRADAPGGLRGKDPENPREMIAETGRDTYRSDGGVKQSTERRLRRADVGDGTGLFRADDPKAVVKTVLGE